VEVFSASIADIKKALLKQDKKLIDPCISLLQYYHEFLDVFSPEEAKKLLPLYRAGIDH
jgi:hypothetical protein